MATPVPIQYSSALSRNYAGQDTSLHVAWVAGPMNNCLVLTIIADDVPGVVERVAETVKDHGGNWLESNLSHLAGKFAGILLVGIAPADQPQLLGALDALGAHGIRVIAEPGREQEGKPPPTLRLSIVANDRAGIVEEISAVLADNKVNVEALETTCERAPMSAVALFRGKACIRLPANLSREDLQLRLEALSEDLMLELED